MTELEIRNAFREQAGWCRKLGSPFTALLCESLAEGLDGDTTVGAEILTWRGNPAPSADALALRVAGALHALVRAGREPDLAALYPPAALPDGAQLWRACRGAFERHEAHFRNYLAGAPQTNEVGRSGVLIAGFLLFAHRFGVPLHLFEIGASAGLNLFPDRYRYRFGDARWGDPAALLELAPDWEGRPPPVDARLHVATRQGSDIAPLDLASPEQRSRLVSYVWADQAERLRRLEAAIETALARPTPIEAMEAADWVERRLPARDATLAGGRVLFHSVFWHYLPEASQRRITARVEACGAGADRDRPFGWLRFELDQPPSRATLKLTCWPGGETLDIAGATPHGNQVTYLL